MLISPVATASHWGLRKKAEARELSGPETALYGWEPVTAKGVVECAPAEVALRQGVTFHNGEVFDAAIVKLNWDEQSQLKLPHTIGSAMNFKPGSRVEVIDPQTVRFVFAEPDGGALAKITLMHMANRQFYRDVGWGTEHW